MKTDILMNGSMVKNHILLKNGIRIPCNTENLVPIVVPGLSSSSSDLHQLQRHLRDRSNSSSSSSTSSSSPTVSEIQTREREDRIESDISPVQVSNSVGDRSGRPDETQANKTQKQIKRNPRGNGATRCVLKSRNGCKNSEKILWMIEFLSAETHTPVLLTKYL